MFRARNRPEGSSRPTATRGSVGSARVWDAHTRTQRAAARNAPDEPAEAEPETASAPAPNGSGLSVQLAPAELSALIAGIVAATLDTRLADYEPARRAELARELEARLGLLFQAPSAPEALAAEPVESPPEAEAPAATPVEPPVPAATPVLVFQPSPAARALALVLEDRLSGLGGTLSERADLRERLIALALATLERQPSDPNGPLATTAELHLLDVLQRRASKLEHSLKEARAALAYVSGLAHVDEGLSSIYRAVQGLAPADPRRTQKRDLLEGIYRANLELQKPEPLPGP